MIVHGWSNFLEESQVIFVSDSKTFNASLHPHHTEANRLPFQGQNSSKEGTEAEKGLEKTPIVLNITLEFSRTTSGDGIRMNAC